MKINLEWVVITNYIFLALIGVIILFIFLRRSVLFPFQAWFERRKKYYLYSVGELLSHCQEIDKNINKALRVKNFVDKLTLEEVLIEMIETMSDKNKQKILIRIYEEMGIAMWRVRQLKSWNVWKRRIAADLLGKSLSRRAVVPLNIALRDKDEDVRLIAAKGLGKLKAKGAIDFIVALFKDFPQEKCSILANILIDFGKDAIPSISKALETPNLKTRFWSLRALAEIDIEPDKSKYEDLEERLDKLLSGYGAKVRAYCAVCLAKVSSSDRGGRIASLLGDNSPVVRAEACRALGILGNPDAIDKLIKCLGDENWIVNYAASRALIKFGKQIKGKLRENLKSPQDIVYKRCWELLGELERNELV